MLHRGSTCATRSRQGSKSPRANVIGGRCSGQYSAIEHHEHTPYEAVPVKALAINDIFNNIYIHWGIWSFTHLHHKSTEVFKYGVETTSYLSFWFILTLCTPNTLKASSIFARILNSIRFLAPFVLSFTLITWVRQLDEYQDKFWEKHSKVHFSTEIWRLYPTIWHFGILNFTCRSRVIIVGLYVSMVEVIEMVW